MSCSFQQQCQPAWGRPMGCKTSAQTVEVQNTAESPATEGRWLLSPRVKHKPLGALVTCSASQLGAWFSGYQSKNLTCLPNFITFDLTPLLICTVASLAGSALYLCFPVSPMPCLWTSPCLCSSDVGLPLWFTLQFVSRRMHSVLSLCCCWVRDRDIFNLSPWSPTAPSCPWMPVTSKGGWLQAMEIWGEVFCPLWSFRHPPCKHSCTHAFLITRALWNPIYLRKIKSHSTPGYHKTLSYRNMAPLERWAFHPCLFALQSLYLVSDRKKGCWSLIPNHSMGPDPAHISSPHASRTSQLLKSCWLSINQAEEPARTCQCRQASRVPAHSSRLWHNGSFALELLPQRMA